MQRVTRRLGLGLQESGVAIVPVGWDWARRRVVTLGCAERAGGRPLEEMVGAGSPRPWLLMPELCLPLAGAGLDPLQLARACGLRTAAVLHDLIPLKLGHLYDGEFLRRFGRYVEMFPAADVVLVGTEHVADELRVQLARIGARSPEIAVIPFGAQLSEQPRSRKRKPERRPGEPLRLVTVSTWEPRKNLPHLLEAIKAAKTACRTPIELAVVGRRGSHADYDATIDRLCDAMPGVTLYGPVDDDRMADLYRDCHASVYPSREEGFGLPIIESLWLATPAICHHASAMAEIARGGGVLTVDMGSVDAIASQLTALVEEPSVLEGLSAAAVARPLQTWKAYATAVASHLRM